MVQNSIQAHSFISLWRHLNNNDNRGKIYSKEAYARGKMLEHGGWSLILPRNITPSDIDMVFDNGGRLLLCELNSHSCLWKELPYGQRLTYQSLVSAGRGLIQAVCCQHSIPDEGVDIDTVRDILKFQRMVWRKGAFVYSPIYNADKWVQFINHFYK